MTTPEAPIGPVAVIDVGGTDTKTGLVHPDGSLTDTGTVPTPHRPDIVEGVLDLGAGHVRRMHNIHPDLVGSALVVPGIVDDEAQMAVLASNMGWDRVPFAAMLAERTGMPAALGHDVATAGLAEVTYGAATGARDAAVIVVGTGIAAALFSGGHAIRGGGFAGEIGHSPVVPDGEPCVCGGRGCLEAIASAGAIARRYTTRAGVAVPGAREVLAAARGGDATARAVWSEATDALALAIAQVAAMLAPQVVVIGGGLSRAGDALLSPVRRRLEAILTVQRRPDLRLSTLGTSAGLLGAGVLARRTAGALPRAPATGPPAPEGTTEVHR